MVMPAAMFVSRVAVRASRGTTAGRGRRTFLVNNGAAFQSAKL